MFSSNFWFQLVTHLTRWNTIKHSVPLDNVPVLAPVSLSIRGHHYSHCWFSQQLDMFPFHTLALAIWITTVNLCFQPCEDVSEKILSFDSYLESSGRYPSICLCAFLWVASEHILHKLQKSLVCWKWFHGYNHDWSAADLPLVQESPLHCSESWYECVECSPSLTLLL